MIVRKFSISMLRYNSKFDLFGSVNYFLMVAFI